MKTSDIYDRVLDEARVIGSQFLDFGGKQAFQGRASTIKCFEDNSLIKRAAGEVGAGRVMVVDGGGSVRVALLGDMIAAEAARNGWSGIIVYGCVRDRDVLSTLDIGIKALASTPRKSVKNEEGQRDIAVQIAGVWVRPGDQVYADGDGIIVLDSNP